MRIYECPTCGHIHYEEDGDPLQGIAPGTPWEDIPEDWVCPNCAATKQDFVLVDE